MVKNCSVKNCISGNPKDRKIRKALNIKQTSLFSVPKDATLLSQWSSILRMELCNKDVVCDYHFKEEDIIKAVRHDFPNGTYQIIQKERWALVPNAIPVNPEPKQYENKDSTDMIDELCQQLDNQPCTIKRQSIGQDNSLQLQAKSYKSTEEVIYVQLEPPLQLVRSNCISLKSQSAFSYVGVGRSHDVETIVLTVQEELNPTDKTESSANMVDQPCQQLDKGLCTIKRQSIGQDDSPQLPAKRCKSIEEVINVQLEPPLQQAGSNRISSESQSAFSYVDVRHSHDDVANVLTVQKQLNPVDKNKSLNSLNDIQCMVNIPPAWYYICNSHEVIFVHVDDADFMEKLRVFINIDMSVTVSFNLQKKYDLDFKIRSRADLLKILEELEKAPVCTGTGIKNMSSSASCNGVIFNNEHYKRQLRNPRCRACRILRHRLLRKSVR